MSELREKMAQALLDLEVSWDGGASWDISNAGEHTRRKHLSRADAIIAALPDMVEPIVWVRHPLGWNCDGFMIDARNLNAIYVMRGLYGKPRFDTVEDAKAACQAHHTAAIMQAFGVQGGEA